MLLLVLSVPLNGFVVKNFALTRVLTTWPGPFLCTKWVIGFLLLKSIHSWCLFHSWSSSVISSSRVLPFFFFGDFFANSRILPLVDWSLPCFGHHSQSPGAGFCVVFFQHLSDRYLIISFSFGSSRRSFHMSFSFSAVMLFLIRETLLVKWAKNKPTSMFVQSRPKNGKQHVKWVFWKWINWNFGRVEGFASLRHPVRKHKAINPVIKLLWRHACCAQSLHV